MLFFSERFVWIPLYASILFLIYKKFGWKQTLFLIFLYVFLIVISDQLSFFLKNSTQRLRPFRDPRLSDIAHFVGKSGGKFGFVSGHATNAFAFAVFSALILKHRLITISLLVWASVVAYSRVYLGVHFPGDILGGAVLGSGLAFFFSFLHKIMARKFQWLTKKK